ncbi:MAG: PilZ domain-containing protein [Lachnospiraceae bacterium]
MEERRKSKRSELKSTITIKRLDQDTTEYIEIDIVDVSKSGVGFNCKEPLIIGAMYESDLRIWTQEILHAILEIVRIEKKGDMYSYGATFVGMPAMDSFRIEAYQAFENER